MLNKNMPESVVRDAVFGREAEGLPSSPEVRASAIANSTIKLSDSEMHDLIQKETANVNNAAERLKNARTDYENAKSKGDKEGESAAEDRIGAAKNDLEKAIMPLQSLASRPERELPERAGQNIASIYEALDKAGIEYKSSGGEEKKFAPEVKKSIIKHPDTSLEIIAHMMEDKNKEVAREAKSEMTKRSKIKKEKSKKTGASSEENAAAQETEDEEEGSGE